MSRTVGDPLPSHSMYIIRPPPMSTRLAKDSACDVVESRAAIICGGPRQTAGAPVVVKRITAAKQQQSVDHPNSRNFVGTCLAARGIMAQSGHVIERNQQPHEIFNIARCAVAKGIYPDCVCCAFARISRRRSKLSDGHTASRS